MNTLTLHIAFISLRIVNALQFGVVLEWVYKYSNVSYLAHQAVSTVERTM